MRRIGLAAALVAAVLVALLSAGRTAEAGLLVTIHKSTQRMTVAVDGSVRYIWAVSTGRRGFGTPSGTFHPQMLARTWFSRKYYNSPMPYAIFFHRGFAIHGSYEISRLGGPASHGCIRLHPGNAATLFALVKSEGMGNTIIQVSGQNPAARPRRRVEPQAAAPEYDNGAGAASGYYSPGYTAPNYGWRPAPFFAPTYTPYRPQY